MTRKTVTHIDVVEAGNGDDFQNKLNELFLSLAEQGVKFKLETSIASGYKAFVISEQTADFPESIREQFEEGGEKHSCIECPYFVRPTDGRRKFTKCPKLNRITKSDNFCCDLFYEELFEGKIDIIKIG